MTCLDNTMHSYGDNITKLNQRYCIHVLATQKETAKTQRETMQSQISKQLHPINNQPADTDAINALVTARVEAILEEKDLSRLKDAITKNKPEHTYNKKDKKKKIGHYIRT